MGRKGIRLSLVLGLVAFLLDRGQKFLQIEILHWHGGEIVPVTSFFDYVMVWNHGISYGLLTGLPPLALAAVMVLAIALIVWWWLRAETILTRAGLAIILGGALSHLTDRLVYGAVPDFFYFHWRTLGFYVFNLSDTAITLGVILLLLDAVWAKDKV